MQILERDEKYGIKNLNYLELHPYRQPSITAFTTGAIQVIFCNIIYILVLIFVLTP